MKVQLNFARAPFRNERLPSILYGLAAAVLLAASIVHGVVLTRYLMREQEELDAKVEALQNELLETEDRIRSTEDELRSQRSGARTERIRFLDGLYRLKGFSWTGLFNELETLTPAAVRITSITPAAVKEEKDGVQDRVEVELQIVARSLGSVLEMVKRLEEARYLTTVLPLVEGEAGEREGRQGVAAVLTLQYLPHEAGAPDRATPGTENEPEQGNKPPGTTVNEGEPNAQAPPGEERDPSAKNKLE